MTPILLFLEHGILPEDPKDAQQVKYKVSKFYMSKRILYRKAFLAPLLRCVILAEANYCLEKVHTGICRDHLGGKALTHKILRQGYFWPIIHKDAKSYVQKCHQCQIYANVPKQPTEPLFSILSLIAFAVWGIDLVGPLSKAPDNLQFCIMAVNYMTKWVEAKAL